MEKIIESDFENNEDVKAFMGSCSPEEFRFRKNLYYHIWKKIDKIESFHNFKSADNLLSRQDLNSSTKGYLISEKNREERETDSLKELAFDVLASEFVY